MADTAIAGRALVLTPDQGWLDRRIAQQAASLATAGWSVDVAAAADPTLAYDGELPPGVRLLHGPTGAGHPAYGSLRRIKRAASRRSGPLHKVLDAAHYAILKPARQLAMSNHNWLTQLGPYDITFAHDIPVLPLAIGLRDVLGGRLVCDLHEAFPTQGEVFPSKIAQRYWTEVEARISETDHVLFVNEAVERYVRSTHPSVPAGTVILNSVPYSAAEGAQSQPLRHRLELTDSMKILLFAGSLRQGSNLELLVRSFDRASLDNWVLAIVGEGPTEVDLARLIKTRRLERRVFLAGRVSQRELVAVATDADAGVVPYAGTSFNTRISTPNKVFEYVQARLPMVGSRLPSVERLLAPFGTYKGIDFVAEVRTSVGIRRFCLEEYPKIPRDALDRAARRLCWEVDEVAFFAALASLGLPVPKATTLHV